MIITHYTYSLSSADIAIIRSLGYSILSESTAPESFINTYFANLDLSTLLTKIDAILRPYYKRNFRKELHLRDGIPSELLILIYSNDDGEPDNDLALYRRFTFESPDLVVWHEFFRLPKEARGLGTSKLVSHALLQQYVNMGVKKVRIHAALSDGGYVWARSYFTADNKTEVDRILRKAQSRLDSKEFAIAERIHNNYYTKYPDGKAFPMNKWAELAFMKNVLRGSQWYGTIDLKNPEQFNNFTRYVIR